MGETALVSIVVPTYNRASMLGKVVQCILSQTYRNMELIIVNDGSKDNTADVLKELAVADPRVQVHHKPNGGVADTLNYGFARAVGKYVTWTSDDNYYYPEAIRKMVGYLESNPDIAFVYTDARDVDADGNEISIYKAGSPENLPKYCNIRGCLLYRREVNDIVGPYDRNWPTVQDYDFYRRAYEKVKMGYIPEVLYDYTVHEASMSGPHIQCVWEHGRLQETFAKSWRERRCIWAGCFAEIARTESKNGRKWHAVYYRLRAMLNDFTRWRDFWDALWKTCYSCTPEFMKRRWRQLKTTPGGNY